MKEIKVGSEWKTNNGNEVIVKNVCDFAVEYQFYGLNETRVESVKEFLYYFTPLKDFVWYEVVDIKTEDGYDDLLGKDLEILHNYKRFRKEVDTAKLDWDNDKKLKWGIEKMDDGEWYVEGHYTLQELGALYFSNEEYAEQFLDLVKENIHDSK